MGRRYAILDDNDRRIASRLDLLRARLPALVGKRVCAAMVIGSVAQGRARDTSDLDLLLVLRDGLPRRKDYTWWDTSVAPQLDGESPEFPVGPVFVGRSALHSSEAHLRSAMAHGIPLWDPEGVFDDQPRSRA